MHSIFQAVTKDINWSGDLRTDVAQFLTRNHHDATAAHSLRVADAARTLAARFHVDVSQAETAGLLHDISAVYPNGERIAVANTLGIHVLDEELEFPMIVHQKISRVMAEDIFCVKHPSTLDAIECHTTLKGEFTKLDLFLFVADKIEWDQSGTPPYLREIQHGLAQSLEHAAYAYIDFLWQRRATLRVLHPWLKNAHDSLAIQLALT